mgnify:FL=1
MERKKWFKKPLLNYPLNLIKIAIASNIKITPTVINKIFIIFVIPNSVSALVDTPLGCKVSAGVEGVVILLSTTLSTVLLVFSI